MSARRPGVPLARLATQVITGRTLADLGFTEEPRVDGFFVKEAVLPFRKFLGVDAVLGPEMRSTGEVMGHASHFGHAFAKAQIAAGRSLPLAGTVFLSVNDFDKSAALKLARDLQRMGFKLLATRGTAAFCARAGLDVHAGQQGQRGQPARRRSDPRGRDRPDHQRRRSDRSRTATGCRSARRRCATACRC